MHRGVGEGGGVEKRELGRGEGWRRGSWGGRRGGEEGVGKGGGVERELGRGGEGVMERWGGGGREGSDEAQEYS